MKARVFFRSVYHGARLACTPAARLGRDAVPADDPVIISLTTIPSRLPYLHLTIKSLLDQRVGFDRILLWVHRDLEDALPPKLARLQGERFAVRYSETTEPHRKLVETLKLHPERIIVVCDDDMMYPRDWLQRLMECWRRTPGDIVAHTSDDGIRDLRRLRRCGHPRLSRCRPDWTSRHDAAQPDPSRC